GLTPTMCWRRCASRVRRASTYLPVSNAHPGKRIRTRFAHLSALRVRPRPSFFRCRSNSERPRSCARPSRASHMTVQQPNTFRSGPDERGRFGIYGGRFVAETLMPLILDLQKPYAQPNSDPQFQTEMDRHLSTSVGRPSPLYFAERLTQYCGGAKIYFKREELNHTGAHKVNNVLGQIMLALRMGKKRIIAETGAGMHGVAAATLC